MVLPGLSQRLFGECCVSLRMLALRKNVASASYTELGEPKCLKCVLYTIHHFQIWFIREFAKLLAIAQEWNLLVPWLGSYLRLWNCRFRLCWPLIAVVVVLQRVHVSGVYEGLSKYFVLQERGYCWNCLELCDIVFGKLTNETNGNPRLQDLCSLVSVVPALGRCTTSGAQLWPLFYLSGSSMCVWDSACLLVCE